MTRGNSTDERGAMTFLGLVFCLLLIALVFYVLGIGRTILAQEGMQDAADAASFASAVVHARGMNLLVYINWIMAALVAVLVALRLLESLLHLAAGLLVVAGFFTGGSMIVAAQACRSLAQGVHQSYENAKRVIFPILEALHTAEKAVAVIVPAAATLDALVESGETHKPADAVFALPGRVTLPVESDSFSVLCKKGAENVADLALAPLSEIPGVDAVADSLSGAVGGLAESLSGYLCGESGSKEPPSYKTEVERIYPPVPGSEPCETAAECAEAKQAAEQQGRDFDATQPNNQGGCGDPDANPSPACPRDHPFEKRAIEARVACKPRPDFQPEKFKFVQQEVESTYRVTSGGVLEEKRVVLSGAVREGKLPCRGMAPVMRSNWDDYQERGFYSGSPYATPVCRNTPFTVGGRAGTAPVKIRQQIVSHILQCTVKEKLSQPLAKQGERLSPGDDSNKSPMRLLKDLELGTEAFQIRAVGYGEKVGPGKYEKGVRLALWKREPETGVTSTASDVLALTHHFSVAQAEYFFDHDGSVPREEWLWRPAWMGRLRRFRLPSSEEQTPSPSAESIGASEAASYGGLDPGRTAASACSSTSAACGDLDAVLEKLKEGVIH